MCGRFTLAPEPSALLDAFPGLTLPADWVARYNVAPSNRVLAVTRHGDGRAFEMLTWGLIPPWARDPRIGNRLINARAESVAEKPAFRAAFRTHRCLVPADGFYEWRADGASKRPFWFHLASGALFAFAGLWESWRGQAETLRSCALITTDANPCVAPVHDRMPVILHRSAYDAWLDPATPAEVLRTLLVPYRCDEERGDALVGHEVSRRVSSPRNDDAACIAPVQAAARVEPLDLF